MRKLALFSFFCLFSLELSSTELISWVPAYNRHVCQSMATKTFEGYGPSTALTKLALQWWTLSDQGQLKRVDAFGIINDEEIKFYTKWGKKHNIKILLCVYNGVKNWDWNLAKKGFKNNRDSLIQQLLHVVQKYQLDGIDIDFEGKGEKSLDDQNAFKEFMIQLSKNLKSKNKLLSVNSFHSPYFNAPNMSWWQDWRGHVDSIQSMGYNDLYEGSTDTFFGKSDHLFKYSWQQAYGMKLGFQADQIALGLPSNLDQWGSGGRGSFAFDHIQECRFDCKFPASIAIWDMQLQGKDQQKGWKSKATWEALTELKNQP